MKKRISPVTFHYMVITAGFWSSFCVFVQYAAVFLQGAGYTNMELGLIMAVGNIIGAVLGPLLGARIDRNRNVRHAVVISILLALQAAVLVLLRISPVKGLLCSVCFTLYIAIALPVNALNLDLCVRLEHAKASLNFGLARSMGSFSFVIVSTVLGFLIEKLDYRMLPLAGLVITAVQLFGNRLVDRDLRQAEALIPAESAAASGMSTSLIGFFRENKGFSLMLFGTIFIYIAHNIDGNFLINVVRNVGGGEAIMGYLAAYTAIVEVPVMMFASRLPKKWTTVQYIRAAFVFFVLKLLAYALAPNVPLLFAARTLQAPSYALYTVLIVSYAGQVVDRKDSAKAQSLAFSVTNIGSVLSSLIGGRMFDTVGVRPTMLTAAAICAVGAVIAIAATFIRRSAADQQELP